MENGGILNDQITASSEYDSAKTSAYQARLNFKGYQHKWGGWLAAKEDANQWLQIAFLSSNIQITRVATQGRSDRYQWVWKYKLQYSDDGQNFQYYREEGENTDKVT